MSPAFKFPSLCDRELYKLFNTLRNTKLSNMGAPPSIQQPGSEASAPKHVLVVTTIARTVRDFLLPHIECIQRLGCIVSVATGKGTTNLTIPHVDITEVPFSRSAWRLGKHVTSFWKFRLLLRKHAPDLVYIHTPIAAAIVRMAIASLKRESRPHVVYFAHGFHFLRKAERDAIGWLWYGFERFLSRWTDAIIVINKDDQESISRWLIAQQGEVYLLPGVGCDIAHYSENLSFNAEGINNNTNSESIILCIAEVTENKRHDLLLDAFRRIDGRLLLVGAGTNSRKLQTMIDSYDLSDRVEQIGFVSDVRPYIAAADVSVLVSKREGFPRSLMESLAMGTPIAVTRTRGSRDLAESVGCPIAEEATPEAVASAIKDALGDPRSPSEIRDQFLVAWSNSTSKKIEEQISELLTKVLNRNG